MPPEPHPRHRADPAPTGWRASTPALASAPPAPRRKPGRPGGTLRAARDSPSRLPLRPLALGQGYRRPGGYGSSRTAWPFLMGRMVSPSRSTSAHSSTRTVRLSSFFSTTRPRATTVSSGRTSFRNWTESIRMGPASPAQSVTTLATSAIVNMPCEMTPGRPTILANSSFQWIGLKSPEAPAYITSWARSTRLDRSGRSSPMFTCSKPSAISSLLGGRAAGDERGPGHAHHLAVRVRHRRLDGQELVWSPRRDLGDPGCRGEGVAGVDGAAVLEFLGAVHHERVVEPEVWVGDHGGPRLHVQHRGEGRRGKVLRKPGLLGGLSLMIDGVRLSHGGGELADLLPPDLVRHAGILLPDERGVQRHPLHPQLCPGNGQDHAGDVVGLLAGQEEVRVGHVLGLPVVAEGDQHESQGPDLFGGPQSMPFLFRGVNRGLV